MSLLVRFLDRDFDESLTLAGISVSVENLSWAAQGGPEGATLTVRGDERALWLMDSTLRYGVEVINDRGEAIWWGYVHGVEFAKGALAKGISLGQMSNSVAVAYATDDGETGRTAYADDAESVTTYGTKQLLVSADNLTATAAEGRRANELNRRRLPIVSPPRVGGGGFSGSAALTVTLECRGWFGTLDWRYYSRDEGRLVYLPSSENEQKLGWGLVSAYIGFEAGTRYVSQQFADMINLRKGDVFRVSGSASNDGIYTVEQGTERERAVYAASTISFDAATREVRDSANRLGAFDAHDVVQIAGSSSNDGYRRVESASGDGSKVVVLGTLVDEAAGASVTISRGHYIVVEESLVDELPGASVTLTGLGSMVAQSLQVLSAEGWTLARAAVKVQKVGSPADNLQVAIHGDSAGVPGTLLDSATIGASLIPGQADWVWVDLANTQSLTPGTSYWLVVSRTGANNAFNYYEVFVDPDLGYAPEVLRLYNGAAWVVRLVDAHLPFRLAGLEATNRQMEKLLTRAGAFVPRSEVAASGVQTNQWRYGDSTALVELVDLLNLGTSNDVRMLARMTRERTLIVEEEPTRPSQVIYFLRADGLLVDRYNQPLVEVYPPVGQWVEEKGMIPDSVQVSELLRAGPFVLERAEYDVERQAWGTEARDALSVWEMSKIREG